MAQPEAKNPKPHKEHSSNTGGSRRKNKYKIIIRRLPSGLSRDELLHQIEPLDESVTFWVRKANKLMEPWSFMRAYLVFNNWEKAVEFRNRFNGYVFVDKQGQESTAIVELSVHQDVPKSFPPDSAKNDKRVGTLESRSEYKEFLAEYNNLTVKKVNNFDELIREVEEKEQRRATGMVQETPLTKFLIQQALEKEKKRLERLARHKPALLSKIESGDAKKKTFESAGAAEKKKPAKDARKKKDDGKKPEVGAKAKPDAEKKPDADAKNKPDIAAADNNEKRKRNRKKNFGPKQEDGGDTLEENGTHESSTSGGKRSKEYAEFGNTVPKLLSRKSQDETRKEPSGTSVVGQISKSHEDSPDGDTKVTEEKPNTKSAKAPRVFTNKSRKHSTNNSDAEYAKKPSKGESEDADEKARRPQRRPERQIYRPPVRTREKESTNKKQAAAETPGENADT